MAFFLNKRLALWIARPEPRWMFLLGLALLALGTLVEISGFTTFKLRRTTVIPFRPATTIVQTGPYRFTRNPMYLGMATSYVGVAFLLDSWWAFLLFPVVLFAMTRYVIAREERYLSSAFGTEYDAYRTRVRRWL